jgi:flavin reductase (DIM6/NTAB) family NADH-FMN oxidoreductase RutF
MPGVSRPDSVSPDDFKAALSRWASGVTVVTAAGPVGLTVSAFSSLSLDPPLVMVSLACAAATCEAVVAAQGFAVHILEDDQSELSGRFAGPGDRFDGLAWTPGLFGAPLLHGGVARLVCERHSTADGGDHLILIGRVVQVDAYAGEPLLYYRGDYRSLAAADG